MKIEEALKSLTTIRDGYLKLVDEKVDSGKVVGTGGLRGEWKSNTPLDDIYRHSAEALDLAIKALEQQPCETIYGSTYGGVSWGGTYKPQQPCEDCISRDDAIELIAGVDKTDGNEPVFSGKQIIKMLKSLPSVTPKARWIPVKWHIKTEVEEYEQYPEGTVMLDCPMPTEGEDVLITIKGKSGQVWVEKDTALKDENGWYTYNGYEWVDDIVAWMPLPQPYGESEDKE